MFTARYELGLYIIVLSVVKRLVAGFADVLFSVHK